MMRPKKVIYALPIPVLRIKNWALSARIRLTAQRYRLRGHPGIGDPLRVYLVSPDRVRHGFSAIPFEVPAFGIFDGEWDTQTHPLSNSEEYQMLAEHFENGIPWEETERYQVLFERINQGGSTGFIDIPQEEQSVAHLDAYLEYIDELYQKIATDGYRTQRELSQEDEFASRYPHPDLNEIQVFIGRDGTFIHMYGLHRLAIAQFLDIDVVPVRTRVRHRRWQELRDEIETADSHSDLGEAARWILDHPELADLTELN